MHVYEYEQMRPLPIPVRSHLLGEPGLDDAQQGERRQRTEAVHLDQLPEQTHAQDALQGGDPDEVGQTQALQQKTYTDQHGETVKRLPLGPGEYLNIL